MRPCFCDFLGGVLLLENPKGDNKLNLVKLKSVVTSIFGVKNAELSVFHGETGMWRARGYLVAGARGRGQGLPLVSVSGWAIVFSSLWGSRGSSAVSAAMSLLCPSLWYGWNCGHTESQGPHPPLLAMRQIRTHSPCWVVSLSDSSGPYWIQTWSQEMAHGVKPCAMSWVPVPGTHLKRCFSSALEIPHMSQ